ncbi:hypothetical protein BCR39DRAFT_487923 [Naematelia encephala]|uniref:BRCA1-associated protein 2-domain-containing protein n=1 Tax=Naematelia encephala TaxID=71784 RepID=A0A1Y2AIR3_9TREE|nr:hypothetical protein BCR39DRAFT_487923 [Naematelia encephala]
MSTSRSFIYSFIITTYPETTTTTIPPSTLDSTADLPPEGDDWRLGEITVDWVDFTREKDLEVDDSKMASSSSSSSQLNSKNRRPSNGRNIPGSNPHSHTHTHSSSSPSPSSRRNKKGGGSGSGSQAQLTSPEDLSLQPLLAHFPGPNPLESSVASGVSVVGRGVVHLFRHAPPASLVASIDAHPVGESSRARPLESKEGGEWAGERAEGEDGSLIAILAVPAWMRPADFLEFIGGWATCLEGVRMIREATTPNRSIVLLKFRDPLQAADFVVIFTGRPFSTLDARETCHPIRIHHLVLHKIEQSTKPPVQIAVPAFPPNVYSSRAKDLPGLLTGIDPSSRYELPSCPVCLERLDSTVTGLVTLPCAHTFDCDCLRKWGDSRCPVCRVSHLLLSSSSHAVTERSEATSMTTCSMCGSTANNWICVVCGVVGCGRYEPGKGHARRHWEESGHVLAMELETQRVWDYKGDNYVHRLIQSRNDGKLVELPSASSLVTSSVSRPLPLSDRLEIPSRPLPSGTTPSLTPLAGPSTNDVEKMSTIESITLEYSYLLSSQLESMRQHYETETCRLAELEEIERRAREADKARVEAEAARQRAEKKTEKATQLSRALQASLSSERAMSQGLNARIKKLKEDLEIAQKDKKGKEEEVKSLEETVRDLMFSLEAGLKIQQAGGGTDEGGVEAGQGGDLIVVPGKEKKKVKK